MSEQIAIKKMECGCIRGHFLCPTAEALWGLYGACHKAQMFTLAAYFRSKYNEHFAEYTAEGEQGGDIPEVHESVEPAASFES